MLHVTNSIKIKNPISYSTIDVYEGQINNYHFNSHYAKQLEEIQQKLPDDIKLTYIYAGKTQRECILCKNHQVHNVPFECKINRLQNIMNNGKFTNLRYNFVAHSDNKRVWWYKYDGVAVGSGQNFIYIDGVKYQTMKWLANIV